MEFDLSLIRGPYLEDILDQPRALQATLEALRCPPDLQSLAKRLRAGEFRCVALTGMGSSFHALHTIHLELIQHGFLSTMVETSELVHYQSRLLDPGTLVVAVSQSGQSAETLRLLELNRGQSAVIAVTNNPESPLARQANAAVLTAAGTEFSVSCKTYVAGLMALRWLADTLCGRDLEHTRNELALATPAVQSYLADFEQHAAALSGRLQGIRHLFLVGRGDSLAAVGTGALIIKESDHFHAEGMSSAAFRHGPFEMLSAETFVLVFHGENPTRDLNLKLVRDIREHKAMAELVGDKSEFAPCRLPSVPRSIRPFMEILQVQMITLALAAQLGREPGRFELATKVTGIE